MSCLLQDQPDPGRYGSHKDELFLRSHAMRHVHVTGVFAVDDSLRAMRVLAFERSSEGCWIIRYACLLGFAAAAALFF